MLSLIFATLVLPFTKETCCETVVGKGASSTTLDSSFVTVSVTGDGVGTDIGAGTGFFTYTEVVVVDPPPPPPPPPAPVLPEEPLLQEVEHDPPQSTPVSSPF